jgi:hypothetical protein
MGRFSAYFVAFVVLAAIVGAAYAYLHLQKPGWATERFTADGAKPGAKSGGAVAVARENFKIAAAADDDDDSSSDDDDDDAGAGAGGASGVKPNDYWLSDGACPLQGPLAGSQGMPGMPGMPRASQGMRSDSKIEDAKASLAAEVLPYSPTSVMCPAPARCDVGTKPKSSKAATAAAAAKSTKACSAAAAAADSDSDSDSDAGEEATSAPCATDGLAVGTVCLDRADVLKRLQAISDLVKQFKQTVRMM